jgi:hypothetical protein
VRKYWPILLGRKNIKKGDGIIWDNAKEKGRKRKKKKDKGKLNLKDIPNKSTKGRNKS